MRKRKINEEQYNQEKNQLNQEIDDLHAKLRTERSNLENDYDDKRHAIEKRIDQNNQDLDVYQARGQEAFDKISDFINHQESTEDDDRQDYLSKINPLKEEFDQKIDEFKNTKDQLEQEQTDLSHQYNNQDEQLQTDIFNDIHQRQDKIDNLEIDDDDSF